MQPDSIAAMRTAGLSLAVMYITGSEMPAALRRCRSSIPDSLFRLMSRTTQHAELEIAVILELLGGRKHDAVVTVLAQQPLQPLEHPKVIIDDKDDFRFRNDGYPRYVALTAFSRDDLELASVRRS